MTIAPSTLPREYYTSDQIYAEEMERIFGEHWVCVGRDAQLSEPGEYLVQSVGGESVLIVRGRDHLTRAFHNVCRHRGSPLCTEASGCLSRSIVCPYHAWAYSLEGRLIGAPHMREVEGFDAAEQPLRPVALESWNGFLFVNLAASPEPLESLFAAFSEAVRPWGLERLRPARRIQYEVRANWKLLVENYSDCYHCRAVHPELNALSDYRNGIDDVEEGLFLGGYMWMNEEGTSLSMSGNRCGPLLVDGERRNRVYYYSLFPNLLLSLGPDYVMSHILWPLAPDRTQVICEWLFDPAAFSEPAYNPEDAVEFWDRTNRQDWRLCEMTQRGVSSRSYIPGPACLEYEKLVVAFDRQVLNTLRHETGAQR
jgi:glycine betaine catabolism A